MEQIAQILINGAVQPAACLKSIDPLALGYFVDAVVALGYLPEKRHLYYHWVLALFTHKVDIVLDAAAVCMRDCQEGRHGVLAYFLSSEELVRSVKGVQLLQLLSEQGGTPVAVWARERFAIALRQNSFVALEAVISPTATRSKCHTLGKASPVCPAEVRVGDYASADAGD